MEASENLLDQLHQLQQKRAAEISEAGQDYRLQNSEQHYKGIISEARDTIKFESRTPLRCGQIYIHKGAEYYVTGTAAKAGYTEAAVAPVIGNAQIFNKHSSPTNETLSASGQSIPILQWSGSALTVPRHGAAAAGKIIKMAGSVLEVTNARISGPLAILTVKQYTPAVKPLLQKMWQPYRHNQQQERIRYWGAT